MKRFLILACIACGLVFFASCDKKDKDQQAGTIYGVVTDKLSGEPIKNAGVELKPTGTKTITGEDGHYEFANVSAGSYYLLVTKSGYNDFQSGAISVSNDNRQCDVQMEKPLTALQVLDNSGKEVNTIDFGADEGNIMRSVRLVNTSDESVTFDISHTATWISSINPSLGTLDPSISQDVVILISRDNLSAGNNTTTVHISTAKGGKDITIKAQNGVTDYYIKHPWNGGEWTWHKMTQEGNNYTYTGYWGGKGVNINTSASDAGANWFPENEIQDAYSFVQGDLTKFSYNPQNETLSISFANGGNNWQ